MIKFNQKLHRVEQSFAGSAVFDRVHFDGQTMGERDLQREIVQLFLNQLADVRKTLSSQCSAGAWRFMTHTLKGAAAAVGANEVLHLAEEWESGAAPETPDDRFDVRNRFDEAVDTFKSAASDLLE